MNASNIDDTWAGYRRMSVAVVYLAVMDARLRNFRGAEARKWIKSEASDLYFDAAGLCKDAVMEAVNEMCLLRG